MKTLIEYINEEKIEKKYYVGLATSYDGPRDLEFVCGPYDTIDDAKKFMKQVSDKADGLNASDYEWSSHINIYRSTKVDYQYVCDLETKYTNGARHCDLVPKQGKHGGNRTIPVKRADVTKLSEQDFIERVQNIFFSA